MYLLKIALLLVCISSPTEKPEPISTWLNAPSITSLNATYSQVEKALDFRFVFQQDFTGEIAILSSTGETIHQDFHSFSSGEQRLTFNVTNFNEEQHLAVFHDFEHRFLKTVKLVSK